MHKRIPIIIDTDISLGTPNAEIDDGAALMFLVNSNNVEIKAITTVHGNASVEIAHQNLIRLLKMMDIENLPVGKGAAGPLQQDDEWEVFLAKWQSQYGPTPTVEHSIPEQDAVDLMIEMIEKHPGEIVVLALGPLTNLAKAIQKKPRIIPKIHTVYAMGGNLDENAPAEFNIRCDPEAADIVFKSGLKIKLHGLSITKQVLFSREDFKSLNDANQAQKLLKDQAMGWIDIVEAQGWEDGGCSLHDAIAASAVVDPYMVAYSPVELEVITAKGSDRGKIVSLPLTENPIILIASQINTQTCYRKLLATIKDK